MNRLQVFAIVLGVFALTLIACGPASTPEEGASPPVAQATEPTSEPTAAPTQEPSPTERAASPTKPPFTPPTLVPTKTPTPGPNPTYAPDPVHPDGLEGCKRMGSFHHREHVYLSWCSQELVDRVMPTCEVLETSEEQRQCGEDIALEYTHTYFRNAPAICAGIVETEPRLECMHDAGESYSKATLNEFEAANKVAVGGNQDPEVVTAMKDTMTCLEEQGFKNVDPYLIFTWQRLLPLLEWKTREEQLSNVDKDLRLQMRQPSIDCAKQHGLFEEQDRAWTAELKRLEKEEPELVADIIRNGFLEVLGETGRTADNRRRALITEYVGG